MSVKKTKAERQEQERKNAYKYGENHTDEELCAKLELVLRKTTFEEIIASLILFTASIEDRNLRIDIQAHIDKLSEQHYCLIGKIADSLEEATYRIPNDVHGTKEALRNAATNMQFSTQNSIEQACLILIQDILPSFTTKPLFTNEDMEEQFQTGYEKGYQKCIQVFKENNKNITERLQQLDLK